MDTGSIMANQMDDLISAGIAQKNQEELLDKNNIFFIEERNESITECFERLFIGGKVIDDCILKLGKDEYGIIKLHRINCDWMRLVSVFKLEYLQPPPLDESEFCEGCSHYKQQCVCYENSKHEFLTTP